MNVVKNELNQNPLNVIIFMSKGDADHPEHFYGMKQVVWLGNALTDVLFLTADGNTDKEEKLIGRQQVLYFKEKCPKGNVAFVGDDFTLSTDEIVQRYISKIVELKRVLCVEGDKTLHRPIQVHVVLPKWRKYRFKTLWYHHMGYAATELVFHHAFSFSPTLFIKEMVKFFGTLPLLPFEKKFWLNQRGALALVAFKQRI